MDLLTLQVMSIVFLATFVRGLTGFGNALVAMPLLALVVPVKVASPLVALTATFMATMMLAGNWRQVNLRSTWRLLLASVPGVIIGLWFLRGTGDRPVRIALALFILCYSLYDIFRPQLAHLKDDRWACVAGFISGIIGGVCNANGPPIVIYGTMRGWDPDEFRATLQGFFLPSGIFITLAHASVGLWNREIFRLLLFCLPAVAVGIGLGSLLARRIKRHHFRIVVHSVLICSATMLLVKALR